MSVVAGCLLLDGVLLTADSRITYKQPNGSEVHVDNALKVMPLAPGTAIGYVGGVRLAAALLKNLVLEVKRRKHTDPITLSQWMPRFLRYEHNRLRTANRISNDPVTLMIASSVNRETIVDREKIFKVLKSAVSKGLNGFWAGGWFERAMFSDAQFVTIPDSHASRLYSMSSPGFEPVFCQPLHFMAIGSGRGAVQAIEEVHDRMLLNHEDLFIQESSFLRSVRLFAEYNNIASTGGLYPLVRLTGNQFTFCGESQGVMSAEGSEMIGQVNITFDSGRWIQRNTVTRTAIPLELPWNIADQATQSKLFDDVDRRKRRK